MSMSVWGHHIAALLPPSVLHFTSQQRSLAASISVSLPKRPFGAPASETTPAGHAYQLHHLTNGKANQRAELRIKGGHISERASFNAHHSSSWHIKKSSQLPDLSRRRKLLPAARPRCLEDRALHHPTAHANFRHSTATHPTKRGQSSRSYPRH
jgi:hypothetical protein